MKKSVKTATDSTFDTEVARQPAASIVAALKALRNRPDATPSLKAIRVPTLVIVGEEDAVTPPKFAKMIAENVPGSKLTTTPNAGHLSNLESPWVFNAAVTAFLKNVMCGI